MDVQCATESDSDGLPFLNGGSDSDDVPFLDDDSDIGIADDSDDDETGAEAEATRGQSARTKRRKMQKLHELVVVTANQLGQTPRDVTASLNVSNHPPPPAHAHSLSPTPALAFSLALSLSLTLSLSLSLSLCVSVSLSHPHSHTHTHIPTLHTPNTGTRGGTLARQSKRGKRRGREGASGSCRSRYRRKGPAGWGCTQSGCFHRWGKRQEATGGDKDAGVANTVGATVGDEAAGGVASRGKRPRQGTHHTRERVC